MTVTKNRVRRLTPRNDGELAPEQKEFILDGLACGWPYSVLKEEFEETFGRKLPTPQAISAYRGRYRDEIARRREAWKADLKSAGIPFVHSFERVSEYSRFARIEIRRKRYKEAREHMHEIALETGDLKERREITGANGGPVEFRAVSDAELDTEIAGRLADSLGSGNEADDPGAAAPA